MTVYVGDEPVVATLHCMNIEPYAYSVVRPGGEHRTLLFSSNLPIRFSNMERHPYRHRLFIREDDKAGDEVRINICYGNLP